MPDFLTLNEFNVPILDGSFSTDRLIVGDKARMFSGKLRKSEVVRKRIFSATTPIITAADANALIPLIEGDGHTWSFDTVVKPEFSRPKGLGPVAGSSFVRQTTSPLPKYGAGYIDVGSGLFFEVDPKLPTEHTVLVLKNDNGLDGGWISWAIRSDGDHFNDGSKNPGPPPSNFITLVGGTAKLLGNDDNGTPALTRYDDFVPLSFLATDAQLFKWTSRANAFSEMPRLFLDGNCIPDGPISVIGTITNETHVQVNRDGTPSDNDRILEFILEEE